MKKQIKIICMLAICVSLFLVNVSNAEFTTLGVSYSTTARTDSNIRQLTDNYTLSSVWNLTKQYNSGELSASAFSNMYEDLHSNGFGFFYSKNGDDWSVVVYPYSSVDLGYLESHNKIYLIGKTEENVTWYYQQSSLYSGQVSTNNSSATAIASYYSYEPIYMTDSVKLLNWYDSKLYWDGESYYYNAGSTIPDTPVSNSLLTSEEFNSMLTEITTSELFYQYIPSDYRKNFFVQYDVDNKQYVFYFYPSNYQVNGLKMNENDYYLYCDKDFSWWDKVVESIKHLFSRETENLDYKIIYVSVEEDNTYSPWYRSKSMLSVEETLFNFELHPIVYVTKAIPFYGKHGGGGINIDTGDETLASSSESMILENIYGEDNIAYNANPEETILKEEHFWDKVVNRLSTLTSTLSSLPDTIIKKISTINGITLVTTIISPLVSGIIKIIQVLISSIGLVSRAVTFVYTLPTIEASSALFAVDVASTSKGINFTGHSWGTKFIEGLEMLKGFSWNGLNLWNLFSTFIAAMFTIQVIKYVRKHYHV